MIDFLLGLSLAAVLIRGWIRGFVKEVLDLLGLVLGVALAFRLGGPLGDFLADRFDVSSEWARLGSGIALFIVVGLAMGLAAHWLGTVVRLPGLNLANRLLGAGFAAAWVLVIVLLAVSMLRVLPMPSAVDAALDESVIVSTVADPESLAQRAFQSVAGDSVLDTILALEPLVGDRRVILEEDATLEIEAAEPDELDERPSGAQQVFELLNDARLEAGVAPLAWSDGLAEVARGHVVDMYTSGFVSHRSPTTGDVVDRVEAAGIRLYAVGENLALAATPRAVHEALMDSPGHRENLLRTAFDRVGVAAVDGPLGLMVVQVFGGQLAGTSDG